LLEERGSRQWEDANRFSSSIGKHVIAIDDETADGRHGAGVFLLGIWLA
jgi:hypothetical protein